MPEMERAAAITVVAIGALVALTTAHQWDYLWEGEYLGKWASLVAIHSLVIAPLGYFLKKKLDARRERRTASIGIVAELASAIDALDEKHGELKVATLDDGQKVYFMNRMLNHGTYDSLVMSGKIIVINPSMQQPIHDIFQVVRDHNTFLQKIREMEEAEDRRQWASRYYVRLGEAEERLLNSTPPLLDELRKECGSSDLKKLRL